MRPNAPGTAQRSVAGWRQAAWERPMANDGPTPAAGPPDMARPKEEGWHAGPTEAPGGTGRAMGGPHLYTNTQAFRPRYPRARPCALTRPRESIESGKGGPDGGWRPIDPPSSGVHALRHGAREGITKLPAESKSTLMTMRALLEPRRGVMWILFVVIIVIRLALLVANRGGNDPATAPTGLAVRPPLRQDPCSERGGRCSAPASRRRASGSPCRG